MRFGLAAPVHKYLKRSFYLCLILLFVGLLPIKHIKKNKRSFTKINANYFTFIPFFALYYAFKLIKDELE